MCEEKNVKSLAGMNTNPTSIAFFAFQKAHSDPAAAARLF
jgi:hypothetical protein